MLARWLCVVVVLLGLCVAPSGALAQDQTPSRVQEALDVTDRRIELAETLLAGGDNPNATTEVELARDIQSRARTAFSASQWAIAARLTLDARGHADRCIAILRNLPDPDRVRVQLERTAELLERARDGLRDCQDDRARSLLRVAFDMQKRAEAGLTEGRYLAALQLSMSARERALKAMRQCKVEDSPAENVSRALSRTDEVIARARDLLSEHPDDRGLQALRAAEQMQSDAQQQARNGHGEQALRMTQSARAMAHRAMRAAAGRSR